MRNWWPYLIASVYFVALICFAGERGPIASAGSAGPGDANCDSRVDSIDASVILQYSAGLTSTLACGDKADVSGDGNTNSVDAALILQFDASLLNQLGSSATATSTRTRTPTSTPTSSHTPTSTSTPTVTPTGTDTPTLTETPESITWLIDSGVSPEDENYIRSGIEMAGMFLDKHLGGRSQQPITVTISSESLCGGAGAWATPYEICIDVDSSWWPGRVAFAQVSTAVHEYFHTFQGQLNCYTQPVWLKEGAAEFVASEVVIENGLVDREYIDFLKATRMSQNPVALQDYETSYGTPDYLLWAAAVERLTSATGLASLRRLCEALQAGASWQEVFEEAFGTTLADFYAAFEQLRQQLEPSSASRALFHTS